MSKQFTSEGAIEYNRGFDDGQDNMLFCVDKVIQGHVDNLGLSQQEKDMYDLLRKLIQKTLGNGG